MKHVAVIGSANNVSQKIQTISEKIGRGIANRGGVLISGGRGGVMEASCRGAKQGNGMVIGILPERRDQANKFVDIAIVTGMGDARNAINVKSADVVISISGGAGTLSEIGLALKSGKKVIAIKSSGGISRILAGIKIDGKEIISVNNEEEALKLAFE